MNRLWSRDRVSAAAGDGPSSASVRHTHVEAAGFPVRRQGGVTAIESEKSVSATPEHAAALDAGRRPKRHSLGGVRGDEARVVDAFCGWLSAAGWTVRREVEFVDVAAVRGDERLYAKAKGRTAAIGTDVDTLYGQLLRRMPDEDPAARYAVVVPTVALKAALRVPAWVRDRLRLDVYEDGREPSGAALTASLIRRVDGRT